MSPDEFNYADNWNFAKVYCSSIIGASEKIAHPELHFFCHFEPLARVHVHEGVKLRRQLEFRESLLLSSLLSMHREYWLNLLVHDLSFLRNFKFSKSAKLIA